MKWFGKESKLLEDQYQDIAGKPLPKGFLRRVCAVAFSEDGQLALGVAKIMDSKQNYIAQQAESELAIGTDPIAQEQSLQPQLYPEQPDPEPQSCD